MGNTRKIDQSRTTQIARIDSLQEVKYTAKSLETRVLDEMFSTKKVEKKALCFIKRIMILLPIPCHTEGSKSFERRILRL